jgi:ubiquitin-conjugating enzyme E2 H
MLNQRILKEFVNLEKNGFVVNRDVDDERSFTTILNGPKDSLYEGGKWELNIHLPKDYPFKSPSIGFKNRIYHPNIDFESGTICLDALNTAWSPMFSLINIFEEFIPQLLLDCNPDDPLNVDAAKLLMQDQEEYENKVRGLVKKYSLKNLDSD